VRSLIERGTTRSVHDLSDGGLAVGLAEMAMASGIGATVPGLADIDPIPVFFGEDQARYLVVLDCNPQSPDFDAILAEAKAAGIFAPWIGTTGGNELKLGQSRALSVADLQGAHESWFPAFMEG
jgi:phosphoribosylformylglycinamidine (FGAM) synthase-like enzyme